MNTESEKISFISQLWSSIAATVLLVVICCGLYPLIVWAIAQGVFPAQANGSLVKKDGSYTTNDSEAVGSAVLGQSFAAAKYFHPRPSAAGAGYDATASGGTNLGPLSDKLLNGVHGSKNPDGTPNSSADFDGVKDLVAQYRKENGLASDKPVPADAVTRSGSGLDPHISLENADLQLARVAKARGVSAEQIRSLIAVNTDRPTFGILGEPGVNVLKLNLALDRN
jgi:K+-transporting ATPase ATPase C chain